MSFNEKSIPDQIRILMGKVKSLEKEIKDSSSSSDSSGLFAGGTTNQVLSKGSNIDYDYVWRTISGSGDVSGPASSVDNAITRFDGTGGKTLQNSAVTIDDNGNLVIPSSATTGFRIFNTVDQTTNTEVGSIYWASNALNIRTSQAGTGANRNIVIGPANSSLTMFASANAVGFFNFVGATSTANANLVSIAGTGNTFSASTGVNNAFMFGNTINQSGSAGFRELWVTPYLQGTGSGIKLLMDIGTNSAANGSGTHTSRFSISSTGLVFMTVPTDYADDTAAKAGGLVVGNIYRTGSAIKIVVS